MGEDTSRFSPFMLTIASVVGAALVGLIVGFVADYIEIRTEVYSNHEQRLVITKEFDMRLDRLETRGREKYLETSSRMNRIGTKLIDFIQVCGCQSPYRPQ